MKKWLVLLFLLFPLSCAHLGKKEPVSDPKPLALTHINIIDATGAPVKTDMTVVITGGLIIGIDKTANIPVPQGARVVDARGKFLIPGLWDMHVHWYDEEFLPLFIANGVTGVRQMFGFPIHLQWRQKAEKGELLVPRQMIASPIVDGPDAVWNGSIKVGNVTEARQAVRKIKNDGFDFVKVYEFLSRDVYFAIADESIKQSIVFGGHVPYSVSAMEASDAGQKHIEHLSDVLRSCSTAENEIRRERAELMTGLNVQTGISRSKREALSSIDERLLDTYDQKKAVALFSRFVKNDTWQCPTLTVLHAYAFLGDANFRNDPRLKYMPKSIRDSWQPENNPWVASSTGKDFAMAKRIYQKKMGTIQIMRSAGVKFLAGTDLANPFCFPGFSLHDELALLVEAGLTPMEALQSATLNPAIFMGKDKSLGTVEKDKIADLVLLEANPLEDIGNTKRIAAVVFGGRLFDRKQLDEMLANAEKAAK